MSGNHKRRNSRRNGAGRAAWALIAVLLAFLPAAGASGKTAPRREAAIFFSDGAVIEGTVLLTPGNDFSLVVFDVDTGTQYKKVRNFNVDVIEEMTFSPMVEKYTRQFTLSGPQTGGPEAKTFHGEPYPIREPQCTVVFNSGETRTGVLNSTVIYIKQKDPDTGMVLRNRKLFLRSKQTGEPGETLEDLVYIKRIKMLDDGRAVERSLEVELLSLDRASAADLTAITQDTLTSVPVEIDGSDGKIEVLSTFGENVFLAARIGGRYVAGWPAEGTERTELFESVEKQLLKKEDYYNERKMLGVLPLDNGRTVLTLVSLRRQVPADSVLWQRGRFEADASGNPMEFFRLSIWKWRRDPETGDIALIDRGSFYRVRVEDKADTPPAGICPELWPIVKQNGKLLVGTRRKETEN